MDTELLRTFLEVHRTGHFGRAADNLYITQSAVSARIKQLEDALGVTLFERQRNNIRLTAPGQRFLRHAETIVGTWQRARQEAGLEDNEATLLSIAGLFDLWEPDLLNWLAKVRRETSKIAIHGSGSTPISRTLQRSLIMGKKGKRDATLIDCALPAVDTAMPVLEAFPALGCSYPNRRVTLCLRCVATPLAYPVCRPRPER